MLSSPVLFTRYKTKTRQLVTGGFYFFPDVRVGESRWPHGAAWWARAPLCGWGVARGALDVRHPVPGRVVARFVEVQPLEFPAVAVVAQRSNVHHPEVVEDDGASEQHLELPCFAGELLLLREDADGVVEPHVGLELRCTVAQVDAADLELAGLGDLQELDVLHVELGGAHRLDELPAVRDEVRGHGAVRHRAAEPVDDDHLPAAAAAEGSDGVGDGERGDEALLHGVLLGCALAGGRVLRILRQAKHLYIDGLLAVESAYIKNKNLSVERFWLSYAVFLSLSAYKTNSTV